MKQNLVAGLVFGAVLLVGARLSHRLVTSDALRLGGAALAGACLPVVATLGWAAGSGVRLETLWYAVYGFRPDALEVIASEDLHAPQDRALLLLAILLGSGAAFVLAGLVVHRRRIWRLSPTLFAATGAVLLVDGASLVLGGSFWRPYLFAFLPGLILAAALLLAVRTHVARRARVLVVMAAVVSVWATLAWTVADLTGHTDSDDPTRTGLALAETSAPGDTVVVYGGKAELVLASGLSSPYPHLWSLPMRALDPDLSELTTLLTGPDAPTWVVVWVPTSAWDGHGEPLDPVLERHYTRHGESCHGHPIYLRRGLERAVPEPDCSRVFTPLDAL
jgi:hypothetical protein